MKVKKIHYSRTNKHSPFHRTLCGIELAAISWLLCSPKIKKITCGKCLRIIRKWDL